MFSDHAYDHISKNLIVGLWLVAVALTMLKTLLSDVGMSAAVARATKRIDGKKNLSKWKAGLFGLLMDVPLVVLGCLMVLGRNIPYAGLPLLLMSWWLIGTGVAGLLYDLYRIVVTPGFEDGETVITP